MNVRATAKYVGTSPRKIGLVAALIRGRKASDAQQVLATTGKRATDPVGKVLQSAIANAENNYNLNARNLVIESVLVGPGPTLKRFRPRAQGRAGAIRKRTSHITVVLSDAAKADSSAAASQPADSSASASRLRNSASKQVSAAGAESASSASDKSSSVQQKSNESARAKTSNQEAK
jgi:large subunit ribosomal protein L22